MRDVKKGEIPYSPCAMRKLRLEREVGPKSQLRILDSLPR